MKVYFSPFISLLLLGSQNTFAQPKISSFFPSSGQVGTTVTISGTNFSSLTTNNIVRFGAVRANISSASSTELTVSVPFGTTFEPISVTTNGLSAFSNHRFIVTFAGPSTFDNNSFVRKADLTTGMNSNPHGVRLGDFDDDGKPDLVVSNLIAGTIAIFRNTSSAGTVSFTTPVEYPSGYQPFRVDVEDLDGDGKMDIAVANIGDSSVSVYRNTSSAGTISFSSKIDYKCSAATLGVELGDIDGDGKADIVATNTDPGSVSVFRNTSTIDSISFDIKADYSASLGARSVAIGDLDGDHKPDLAVANERSASVSILRNTSMRGAISFASKQDYMAGYFSEDVSFGDLDGDGKIDMAVANTGAASISVYRNVSTLGSILFAPKVDFPAAFQPACVSITDFNGDGKPDFAVSSYATNGSVSVFKNTSSEGNISFAGRVSYSTGNSPTYITSGDMDGDGFPEIAVSNNHSHNISILTLTAFKVIPHISIGGPTSLCKDGSVNLTSSAPANNQWYKDGTAIPGAIGKTLMVTTGGAYTVKITINGSTTSSDTIVVVTLIILPTPVISKDADRNLVSSAASGNQWYLNGNLIAGAIGQTYQPIQIGSYAVRNTLNGCISDFSSAIVLTDLDLRHGQYITLYPNPTKSKLNINWNINGMPLLSIQVIDVQGRQLLFSKNMNTGAAIDLSHLSQGIYFIKIYNEHLKLYSTRKIIKAN